MIRYDKGFNLEISKTVRNYNAKITRLAKKGFDYLPEKVSISELKATYFTRPKMRRRLKQLKLFSMRGMEHLEPDTITPMTRYEYKILKSNLRSAKAFQTRQIKAYAKLPSLVGTMELPRQHFTDVEYFAKQRNRAAMNINIKKASLQQIQSLKKKINRYQKYDSQSLTFKLAMLGRMGDLCSLFGGDFDKINKILDKLILMDSDAFVELFQANALFKEITRLRPSHLIELDESDPEFIYAKNIYQSLESEGLDAIEKFENMR